MNDPATKYALVTGASAGFGRGIAMELARQALVVAVCARREDLLRQAVSEIETTGGRAVGFVCDVTDEKQVEDMLRGIHMQFGRLNVLVNNAGGDLISPVHVVSCSQAQRLLELNVLSMVSVIRHSVSILAPGSAIVNMGSAAALRGDSGLSVYSASKSAVTGLTRSLARELAPRIRVNAVAPGMVRTKLTEERLRRLPDAQIKSLEDRHPLGFGSVEDVANAVCFLCSVKARWITGQTLVVDGGLTC